MLLTTLPHLNDFDRQVIAALGEQPFETVLDSYGYPKTEVVARIAAQLGDPDHNLKMDVYYSLKAIRMLILDAATPQRRSISDWKAVE